MPSVVWLVYYLKQDLHPEPKRLIFLVFILGMISAGVAVAVEYVYLQFLGGSLRNAFEHNLLLTLGGVAFIEEYSKYAVIRFKVLKNPEFDEPIDAMIYMITAALGFAALENMLFLAPAFRNSFNQGLSITGARFLGATFLHTLSSATVGFYLAQSIVKRQSHNYAMVRGLFAATILHTLFNYLVVQNNLASLILIVILFIFTLAAILIDFKILRREHFASLLSQDGQANHGI